MPKYSEQDLKYAAEFREEIHREALAIIRKTRPNAAEVIDRHPVEDYFQEHWDYPGKWYTIVAIPYGYKSRKALVDTIVRDTLSGKAPEAEPAYTQTLRDMTKAGWNRKKLTNQLDGKPEDPANDLSALRELSALTSHPIPVPLQGIGERTVRFTGTVAPEEMPARVLEFAGL